MEQEKLINTLPEGWIWTTIPELFVIIGGGTPTKNNISFWNGDINWASVKDIKSKYLTETIDKISREGLEFSNTNIANKGDLVLVTRISPGQVAIVKKPTAVNQDLKILKIFGTMPYEFVYYLLCSFKNKFIEHSSGTTVKGLKINDLNEIKLPLPPLEEQHRIVTRIEELFSELDHAEEELKKAQKQLEVYKQALLKSAFEGKLTEKWREENIPKSYWTLKGEDVFFKKIQIINPNKGLPTGWFYATLGSLSNNYDHQRKPLSSNERKEHKSNYPYYGATEIIDYVNEYLFDGKYILIGEDGANLFSKNKSLSIIVNGRFWVNNHAHVIQTNESEVNMEFLSLYFNTLDLKSYISGTAQPKLNKFALNSIPIVVCSIEEQNKIVQELDTKFTHIDNLNSVITESINKIVISRQSILKKAFEGRLTQQSSNDESVFELISRIRKDKQTYLEKLKIDEKEKPKRKATMEKSNLSVKEVLKNQSEPISVKQIWKQSKFQDDSNIDLFYAELKELEDSIFIELEGKETLIAWRNENQ